MEIANEFLSHQSFFIRSALLRSSSVFANQVFAIGGIEGVAFRDLNENGTQDSGDPLLTNWNIELIDSTGNVAQNALTDDTRAYSFNGHADGPYVVRQILPTGMSQSVPAFRTGFTGRTVTGDWGYIDAPAGHPDLHGPNRWGQIAPNANGSFQSPIDLPSADAMGLSQVLATHYETTELKKIFNVGPKRA